MPLREPVYADVEIGGGSANVLSLEIIEDFNAACTRFSVVTNSTGFSVNDQATILMGYDGDIGTMMTDGYVDSITAERPPGTYRIEGRDKLKKAVDYFIVTATTDPEEFWNPRLDYGHVTPYAIVNDILNKAGLASALGSSPGWELGNDTDGAPFQLVSAWDAIMQICGIGVWKVWCAPNGTLYFDQVLIESLGASSDIWTTGTGEKLLSINYSVSDEDLRNKIVVIGSNGDYIATASAVSEYLPPGFYKTAVISTDLIGSDAQASASASANLTRWNKLTKKVTFECEGDPNRHVQDIVTVTESFTGLDGSWFIYDITHTIDENGYRMRGTLVK
jgi:hypothetical protein